MTRRFITGLVCMLLGIFNIAMNIKYDLPPDATFSYVAGLYTPGVVLIAVSIWLFVRPRPNRGRRG
jgi:hypothetical protein